MPTIVKQYADVGILFVRRTWQVGLLRHAARSDRMTERVTPRRRGSYGIDAPMAPAFLAGMAILYLVLAIVTGEGKFWVALCFILAGEAYYLHGTLRGKFVLWAELLDRLMSPTVPQLGA